MTDEQYLDHDGLRNYDTLIKNYIDKKIAEAIIEYEAGDNIEIEDYEPDIDIYDPENKK